MSRRISTKKRFPQKDSKYNNLLVSLLVNRILKDGKKRLAKRILYKSFELIEARTTQNPILILEKAIRGMLPKNALGRALFRNLRVCVGSEHNQQAQNPQVLNVLPSVKKMELDCNIFLLIASVSAGFYLFSKKD